MAMDPTAGVFTFHDPFAENLNEMLTLMDEQNYLNFLDQQPGHELDDILDPDDPLSDPVIWDFCNNDAPGAAAGEGCSGHLGAINDDFYNFDDSVNEDTANQTPLAGFSVNPQSQYNCSCCQVLREITHTNGMNVKRLEIHGVFGVITHAVLGTYGFDPSFQDEAIQMFDFRNESTQMVKNFMVRYFEACRQEGYDLMQDPLSQFYEALSVGLNELDHNPDDFLQFSPQENTDDCPNSQQEALKQQGEGVNNQVGFMKIPLAMQRERTRKLRLKDFKDFYDLPIEDAAKRMNICPTVMKKICRKNGVVRWPYRKVKSIKKKISKKNKILNASDGQERAMALMDIQKHQQELATIYESFNK